MECQCCGSRVIEITYQARSADEASRTILTCPNCPLDAKKMHRIHPTRVKQARFIRYPVRSFHTSLDIAKLVYNGRLHILNYTVERQESVNSKTTSTPRLSMPCTIKDGKRSYPILGYYTKSLLCTDKVLVKTDATLLCPRIEMVSYNMYSSRSEIDKSMVFVEGNESVANGRLGSIVKYTPVQSRNGQVTYSTVLEDDSGTKVRLGVRKLLGSGLCEAVCEDFIGKSTIAVLMNSSPRAWDVFKMQESGHWYTPKIDGERSYVIAEGCVAYCFSKGKSMSLTSFTVLDTPVAPGKRIVLDVEYTTRYGMFLIDVLVDSNGIHSSETRTIEWAINECMIIQKLIKPLVVRIKPYYRDLKQSIKFSENMSAATDGVIAIEDGSTSSKKIKNSRSIELCLTEGMSLVTSDNEVVIASAPQLASAAPGDIVEVRFTLGTDGKTIEVESMFVRVDKVKANGSEAVSSIIKSFRKTKADEETLRRSVLLWCNSVRKKLVSDSIKLSQNRRIILDIGSGDGQSIDALTTNNDVSYLLVEPEVDRCIKLSRRLKGCPTIQNPADIPGVLKQLKSRAISYCILNCQVQRILENEDVCKILMPEIRCATAFFSAQFVVAELYELSNYWNIPFIGCCYAYDGVGVGESIIDSMGILMKRTDEYKCSVSWGSDKVYEEPYVTKNSFAAFSKVTNGYALVDVPADRYSNKVSDACSKVIVVKSS